MSSPQQSGLAEQQSEPKGLKKFMRRASLVLKPRSKKQSISEASTTAPNTNQPKESPQAASTSSTPTSAPTNTTKNTENPISVPAQMTQSIQENKPTSAPVQPRIGMSAKEASALQEEKAKLLFAKYGLTLEPGEWTTPMTAGAPRVEKQVRIRVHRTCHRCQTAFGSDRICNNCQHTRCKKCPRFPGAKPKVFKGKGIGPGGVIVDDGTMKSGETYTMPHRTTGKEMTRKVPTQRVRRTCHECQTLFKGKAKECGNCKHTRCPKCPRDPPKVFKYPDGYPGDTEENGTLSSKIDNLANRRRFQWNCNKCDTVFKEDETTCAGCGHEKCDECPRIPLSRKQSRHDQEAIESVEERMRGLDVSPQASAA